MLYAVAIYSYDDSNPENIEFKKIQSAQQDSSRLFTADQLANLENKTLPRVLKHIQQKGIFNIRFEDEYHYFQQLHDQKIVMAMVSRKKLDLIEQAHLFANMATIHLKQGKISERLDDIVKNPLGFTGRDIKIDTIQKDLKTIIAISIESIDKVIERREKIETLKEKTTIMLEHSIKFKDKTTDLNRRCCSG